MQWGVIIPEEAPIVALFLTVMWKVAKFRDVKNKRRINALIKMSSHTHRQTQRLRCDMHCKIRNKKRYCQIICLDLLKKRKGWLIYVKNLVARRKIIRNFAQNPFAK